MARSKTSNPDQLFEAEAQSLLATLERNSAALPEFWASAKASAVAKAAATADRKRSETGAPPQQTPTGTAGPRPHQATRPN